MHAWLPQDWITSHKKRGIQPVISNPSRQVMHLLEKAGIPELIGEEYITVRVNDAVLMCQVSTLLCPTPLACGQVARYSLRAHAHKGFVSWPCKCPYDHGVAG